MIIQSDSINTNSRRSYSSSQASFSNVTRWNRSGATTFSLEEGLFRQKQIHEEERSSGVTSQEDTAPGTNEQSSENESLDNLMSRLQATGGIQRVNLQDRISAIRQIREQAIDYLLYILFGRKSNDFAVSESGQTIGDDGGQTIGNEGGQNTTFFYQSEQETTCFDAQGTVHTADGRDITFNMNVEMSRSFTEIAGQTIDFGSPRLCDPLVINLDGNVADVSDQKFFFDLDSDGSEESISLLHAGSGYLALDKNDDGIINNGSELFGTTSGNGFSDLAQYDKDNNGWIDEADEIFSKLRIWIKDTSNNDKLISLSEAGVGAICLGSRNTEFSLNSLGDNHTNAVIRKTGLFLYENGQPGTIQQMDLAT